MGPRLKVSSDRLVKPGIEPAIPGLQGQRFIHYTTAASKKTSFVTIENDGQLCMARAMCQLG